MAEISAEVIFESVMVWVRSVKALLIAVELTELPLNRAVKSV